MNFTRAIERQFAPRAPATLAARSSGILLTLEQIQSAPAEVRDWLMKTLFSDGPAGEDFGFEPNRTISDDKLATLGSLEVKNILAALGDNYMALQIFFRLGCTPDNPVAGGRQSRVLSFADFKGQTDVGDTMQLRRSIQYINEALHGLRNDPEATVCQIESNDRYRVHCTTQHSIHRFWERVSTMAAERSVIPFPTRLARTLDGRQGYR
jgi:hypothetical protein